MAEQRLVITGASNVSMLLGRFVDASRSRLGEPVEYHIACAFGRSYVTRSRSWRHKLPAISKTGIQELPDDFSGTTYSLLADVGNDIFIGVPGKNILSTVRMVLEKMLRNSHNVVMTELPVGPAEKISPLAFRFFKGILFRRSDITLDHLLNLGRELNAGMLELAEELGVVPIRFDTDWYRPDAIHFKTRHADQAVAKYLTALGMVDHSVNVTPSKVAYNKLKHHLRYRSSEEVWSPQPARLLADGSSISLY